MRKSSPIESPMSMDDHKSHSVSVRKIDNGFVRQESHSGPEGYSHKETFHRKHPGLEPGKRPEAPEATGSRGLSGCKDCM